jgi:transcriptional antiterminator
VLFGYPVPKRAEETGVSERTLQRRIKSFAEYGIEGFLSLRTKPATAGLTPNVRRLIVDLKGEYPPFNLNEGSQHSTRLLR